MHEKTPLANVLEMGMMTTYKIHLNDLMIRISYPT